MRTIRGIKVGDLVFPRDSRDFLFASPNELKFEADPIELFWDDIPGVVVDVVKDPGQDYSQIRVMVGEVIGWTYSDYVKVIRKSK